MLIASLSSTNIRRIRGNHGYEPKNNIWKSIWQLVAGYHTLRCAGVFNLPISLHFAVEIGVSQMKLIEEINLPNGLKLNIFDLSREIAAATIKVEISFTANIDLQKSFFADEESYRKVAGIFGNTLTYEYKMERAYVPEEKCAAVREELISTFKTNSLDYLCAEYFPRKLALSMLRDINNNPYKYQVRTESET
jgi:hypothetical protein